MKVGDHMGEHEIRPVFKRGESGVIVLPGIKGEGVLLVFHEGSAISPRWLRTSRC